MVSDILDHPIYMTLRSQMSSILDLTGAERPELFALELKRIAIFGFCLLPSIYSFLPISTKLRQNIYNHKILDELGYGSNGITTTGVICS